MAKFPKVELKISTGWLENVLCGSIKKAVEATGMDLNYSDGF